MTKEFTLQPRPLPLDDGWDVIVVGGGPAGCLRQPLPRGRARGRC